MIHPIYKNVDDASDVTEFRNHFTNITDGIKFANNDDNEKSEMIKQDLSRMQYFAAEICQQIYNVYNDPTGTQAECCVSQLQNSLVHTYIQTVNGKQDSWFYFISDNQNSLSKCFLYHKIGQKGTQYLEIVVVSRAPSLFYTDSSDTEMLLQDSFRMGSDPEKHFQINFL